MLGTPSVFPSINSPTNTSVVSPVTVDLVSYLLNITGSKETNIEINITEYLKNLTEKKKFTMKANGTCTTTSFRTNITYELVKNGNQTFSKWISLNTITEEYYGRAPLVENDTLFSFLFYLKFYLDN